MWCLIAKRLEKWFWKTPGLILFLTLLTPISSAFPYISTLSLLSPSLSLLHFVSPSSFLPYSSHRLGPRIPKTSPRLEDSLEGFSMQHIVVPNYSWLWFITAKVYKVNSSEGKAHGWLEKETRHKLPVESHRTCLISLAMSCDSIGEISYQGSSLQTQCLEQFLSTNWPHRHFLLSMYQNSRLLEGM